MGVVMGVVKGSASAEKPPHPALAQGRARYPADEAGRAPGQPGHPVGRRRPRVPPVGAVGRGGLRGLGRELRVHDRVRVHQLRLARHEEGVAIGTPPCGHVHGAGGRRLGWARRYSWRTLASVAASFC